MADKITTCADIKNQSAARTLGYGILFLACVVFCAVCVAATGDNRPHGDSTWTILGFTLIPFIGLVAAVRCYGEHKLDQANTPEVDRQLRELGIRK